MPAPASSLRYGQLLDLSIDGQPCVYPMARAAEVSLPLATYSARGRSIGLLSGLAAPMTGIARSTGWRSKTENEA